MNWILILVIFNFQHGVSATSIKFKSKSACEQAMKWIHGYDKESYTTCIEDK